MASPPEEPPKLSLEEVELSAETTLKAKVTIDDFFERRKRAEEKATDEFVVDQWISGSESVTSDIVTLHSIKGNTYRVKILVEFSNDVSSCSCFSPLKPVLFFCCFDFEFLEEYNRGLRYNPHL